MKIINIFIKIKEKLQELYKKNKKLFFITIVLAGVLCVLLFIPNQSKESKQSNNIELEQATSSYSQLIENKIEYMLSSISSIKLAKVMVVVDATPQLVYLKQHESTKTTNSSGESLTEKEEIVYEKNGSLQTPVLVSTIYPKITGVMLVLNHIDASTKNSIQNAIAGVLNIETSCIFILQDR